MKKILVALAALAACSVAFAQPRLREDNIDEILKVLTVEEKVQLLVGGAQPIMIGGIPTGVAAEVPGAAGNTRPVERLGIPGTVLADGPAGVRISPTRDGDSKTYYATAFPMGTLLASSWDTDLVKDVTSAMGNEVLEYGVDVLLAPGMNIHRNPLCGRNFEYFSEDPLLSGKMGAAYINGIQSQGVGVSMKHYAGNNQETNRNENDARVSQRALREIYLKNFEIAVKEAHPWTVMSSYNKVNGTYSQQSYDLLTTILRDEWGFDGIVMTDWGNKANTVAAVKAGNDLMEGGSPEEIDKIMTGVKDGRISQEELDRNVRRVLEYIVKTPRFKGHKFSNSPDLKAHAEVARRAAAESIVLLRNEGHTLPLKGNEKIALYGVSSVDFVAGGTGSGSVNKAYVVEMPQALEEAGFTLEENLKNFYALHRDYERAKGKLSSTGNSLMDLLLAFFGGSKLPETALPEGTFGGNAKNTDAAIVVLGRNAGEGFDRKLKDDFKLTAVEMELLQNVSTAFHQEGKKVIVVLNIGGVIETASWKDMADAIVLPWSPGQEGARAVADVLTGKVNPSGKLPMTFPLDYFDVPSARNFPYDYDDSKKNDDSANALAALFGGTEKAKRNVDFTEYEEDIWVGYRHYDTKGIEVSYPFGFGLSYTTFVYSKPVVKAVKDGFTASITVTNTGSMAGKEAVQLYVSAPAGSLDKPARELKAFAKTKELKPGESQTLTMTMSAYDLASFNEALSQWETAAGSYKVLFGASVEDIRCTASYKQAKALSWSVNNVLAPQK